MRKAKLVQERTELIYAHMTKGDTIRKTAEAIGVSKSTVHKYIHKYGQAILGSGKYQILLDILQANFEVKSLRGGEATRKKYAKGTWSKNYDKGQCNNCQFRRCPAGQSGRCLKEECPMYDKEGCKCCEYTNYEQCPYYKEAK